MEPVECLGDTDRNGVFRVTDAENQVIRIIQSDGTHSLTTDYPLSGVALDTAGEG